MSAASAQTAEVPSGWRPRLGAWIEGRGPREFIIGVIVLNAAVIGLQTSDAVTAEFGSLLSLLNLIAIAIFVVEITLKLVAFGFGFFRSGWNIFDFVVVGVALIPASGSLAVLRSLRVLRVLRLISQASHLRNIVEALGRALPGIGWTAFLLLLIFYVFAVMGTELFGDSFPEYFGGVPESMFSLFQVMTLESWSSAIARPVIDAFPLAWLYFVPFILIASFMVLNLFIAIIVSATQSLHDDEVDATNAAMMEEIRAIRSRVDQLHGLNAQLEEVRALRAEVDELAGVAAGTAGGSAPDASHPDPPAAVLPCNANETAGGGTAGRD